MWSRLQEMIKARRDEKETEPKRSPEETRYVHKLDLCLLAFCCLSQVIKYLDQQNINFAYTAGMKEDLHLYGRELNYFLTYFQVGYCIFLIPSLLLLTRFRPALYLSALEFIWGCLTLGLAGANNAKTIYALRAFIGATESSAYPGAIGLLMSWYTPYEMAKRIGFYHSAQGVGAMLAGALQAAIFKSLNGKHGLEGWRWNFIINGIITIVIAICGVFMIPDFPQKPSSLAVWLRPKDRDLATRRLEVWRRKSPNAINLRTFKQIVRGPIVYHLSAIYAGALIACQGTQYLNLFLKSLTHPDGTKVWSTADLSTIPIGGYAIRVAGTWILAFASDFLRMRWQILIFLCLFGIPPTVILTIWTVPTSAKYYAYFALFFTDTSGPLIWAWLSDMLPTEAEQRTLIVGVCGTTYYAISAWSNPLIYPANQAPRYTSGWAVCLGLWIFTMLVIISMRIWDARYVQPIRRRLQQEEALEIQAAHEREQVGKEEAEKVDVNVETSPVALAR